MKNILVTIIFLFSQIGQSAEKINSTSIKTYHIENETFSSLILTKDELIHLSDEDKTKYLFSLIALAQILEGSQNYQMGYEGEEKLVQAPNKKTSQLKIYQLFNLTVPQAEAFILPLLARLGLGEMLLKAGTYVVEKGSAAIAARAAAARAVVAVSEPRLAMDTIKEGSRVLVTQKGALEALKKLSIENAQKLKQAEEALVKATNEKKGVDVAWKEYDRAKKTVESTQDRFIAAGGTKKEFAGLLEESKIKSIFMWPFRNKTNLVVGGLATYGADTMLLEKTGVSAESLLQSAKVSVSQFILGTDASGPGRQTPEQMAATTDSKKEKGNSCLFGGTPSVWKDFGDGDLKCTRSVSSENAECKKDEGKFQCPSYGVKLASGSLDKDLCIPTMELTDLTVRCSKALKSIIETKKASIEEKDLDQFGRSLKEAIANLEANDRMKDESGQTKSISVYCQAKSVEQVSECDAIKEVIAVLKTTDIQKIYATRRLASAGNEAGKSEAEKAKQ